MQLKNIFRYSLVVCVLLSVLNCKEDKPTKTEDKVVVSFKKEGILTIKKSESDSIIKL